MYEQNCVNINKSRVKKSYNYEQNILKNYMNCVKKKPKYSNLKNQNCTNFKLYIKYNIYNFI